MTALYDMFRRRNWERNPRRGSRQPAVLCHRFPIKGGLTFGEALAVGKPNLFFETFRARPESK